MTFSQEKEFWQFRQDHPELRFWQALRHFAGVDKIMIKEPWSDDWKDTFYWQDIRITKNENKKRD